MMFSIILGFKCHFNISITSPRIHEGSSTNLHINAIKFRIMLYLTHSRQVTQQCVMSDLNILMTVHGNTKVTFLHYFLVILKQFASELLEKYYWLAFSWQLPVLQGLMILLSLQMFVIVALIFLLVLWVTVLFGAEGFKLTFLSST